MVEMTYEEKCKYADLFIEMSTAYRIGQITWETLLNNMRIALKKLGKEE